MNEFKVPDWLKAKYPWLTEKYIKKNAWYPVCDEWLKNFPKDTQFNTESPFGPAPWKGRDEFRPGDIIVFNEHTEWEDEEGWRTDRFIIIEQEDIEQYQRGERELLPVGIVVHPPQAPDSQIKLKFQ